MSANLYLKHGKQKPLLHRHPWIFSGAVARVENASDGDTVEVYDAGGQWLARASYNSRSQIVARVWTFERDEPIDRAFFQRRIQMAILARSTLQRSNVQPSEFQTSHAYRIVNAESDFLPGLVIDRYGDFLVTQFLTLGAELHKSKIVETLKDLFNGQQSSAVIRHSSFAGIYERSDVDVRKKEGLKETTGVLWGAEPPDKVEITETVLGFPKEFRFLVDVKRGHKTGFYLDQRVNRERTVPYLRGEALNAFAYTGAFGVYAAKYNNANVLNLDASASSLELARENFELNAVAGNGEFVVADAFEKLREYRAKGRKFDAIVLDPPKFVTSAANLERATRGYKDLNMLAFQLLNPNGFLVTFSCSGLVDAKLFQQIVFAAAADAKRDAQILEKLGHSPEHPIGLHFPEGEYLKGLILRVL